MTRLDDSSLVAFVDGELDPGSAREVAAAVARDPEAQDKVRRLRQSAVLVRAVFDQDSYQQVSPHLARSLRAAPSRLRRVLPIAAAIAIAAIGFAGGFGIAKWTPAHEPSFGERLLEEVADYHVMYARESVHQVEAPGDQREHIEAWLGSRLHRDLHVPDLSARGLTFAGARLLVVDGMPVAQLLYHWPYRPHKPLKLCISYGSPGTEVLRTDSRDGVREVLWRSNGYTYVVVGWASQGFLTSLAAELMPQLNSAS